MPGLEPALKTMDSIALESVHKVFHRRGLFFRRECAETIALKDISVRVSAGEVFGLLGPNGSGKSTTLKLISTTLLPDRGRVLVQGQETCREGQFVRRAVGFSVASERSFFPRLTARENLQFFAALEDVPRREISDRIAEVLARVGMLDAANKQVMKFSSGMHQRLGIARALIKRPSILLLDEPTRSLDVAATEEMWNWIGELAADGTTVMLASHNFEEVTAVCDRVALLRAGESAGSLVISGMEAHELREFYLEMMNETCSGHIEMEVPA